jgi:transcriptional regulator with XRE-family HTH domain
MNKDNMGSIIAELRKEKSMTQQDLADKLNVTDKAVSKWERGISCPDINTIPQLAEILGITPNELMGYCEQEPISKHGQYKEDIKDIIQLVLKALSIAMGIASLVIPILDKDVPDKSILTLLAIGLASLGIAALNKAK